MHSAGHPVSSCAVRELLGPCWPNPGPDSLLTPPQSPALGTSSRSQEILTPATTCMNLEDTMLCEISPHKKTNTVGIHSWELSKVAIFPEIETRLVATRRFREVGKGGSCDLMGADIQRPVRERQIPYDLTHMWNLRNKTDEHVGGEEIEKNKP